jgi:hypothetical protein
VDTAETGAPVFAQPREVKCPFKSKGTVFQTGDGEVHGVWISGEDLVHTRFDRNACEFREHNRVKLDKAVKSASNLAILRNADGTCDLAFEMSNGGKGTEGHPWTEEWRPYNSSGIAAGEPRYRYLSGARLPSLLNGPVTDTKQITRTKTEVYYSMHGITPVNLGVGHERDLVTGSRQGNLTH